MGASSKCKTKSNNIGLEVNGKLTFDENIVGEHFITFFY